MHTPTPKQKNPKQKTQIQKNHQTPDTPFLNILKHADKLRQIQFKQLEFFFRNFVDLRSYSYCRSSEDQQKAGQLPRFLRSQGYGQGLLWTGWAQIWLDLRYQNWLVGLRLSSSAPSMSINPILPIYYQLQNIQHNPQKNPQPIPSQNPTHKSPTSHKSQNINISFSIQSYQYNITLYPQNMKREQFLSSSQLKLNLLSMQKKILQLRHRFVIEVVTDHYVEQVKKTYREFQYFSKIMRNKLGLKDKQLVLEKHFRSNNNYKDLELYINRLNCGYLNYRPKRDIEARRNAELYNIDTLKSDVLTLEPVKTRQLRNYLYDLLFRQDELFVDGVDDESEDDLTPPKDRKFSPVNLKSQFKKDQSVQVPDEERKNSRNPIKKLFQSMHEKVVNTEIGGKTMNQIQKAQINIIDVTRGKSKPRQKSNSAGKLKKAFLSLTNKAKNATTKPPQVYPQSKNLKNILKSITSCWIKFPNNYEKRDRNIIYRPFIWEQYDIKLNQNMIEFINTRNLRRHRKIFVIFQADVQLNFDEYTKLIVRNKVDKNPLEIRLSLTDAVNQLTEQYLALYTYIKENVKDQEEKLKLSSPLDKYNKVCNKVRVRISLKPLIQKSSSLSHQALKSQVQQLNKTRGSQLLVNIPHKQPKNDQKELFEFKELREVSDNLKNVNIKIVHSSINISVSVTLDTYVDIDFPVLDNFGALDISVIQNGREGFLPIGNKDAFCTFHVPVQTIYDYMYNIDMPKKKKQAEIKNKMIEIKHTKVNLTVDYKGIGNCRALCSYNPNDIFQQDQPPQQFNRDEFRMNNNRLKRAVWSTELYIDRLKDLKNFTFPNLSYLFYMFLAISCLFYDNNNFLFWLLMLLLTILFYNSPAYSVYIRDIVDFLKIKARKNRLDVFLFKKNKLIQFQYVVPTKKVLKIAFLQQFILTRKVKRSIYKRYKRLLQVLLQAQIFLTKAVSMAQKIKNIFIWYHYEKTKLLFSILAACVFALMILPARIILFCLLLKMMLKGSKYHANIQDINKVIIIELVRIIIRENNFSYMNVFFKEHYRPLDFQNGETIIFFKTCNQLISDWLEVKINMEEVVKKSSNMTEFMINLSKCKTKYKIRKQICQQFGFSLEWSKTESSLKKYFELLYGFIVTVPSDKYIMGVKQVTGNDDEQVEEAENIIDRELLNF